MESNDRKCPICGAIVKDELYYICGQCGWEQDPIQEDNHRYCGGANDLSMNQYRKAYAKKIKKNPNYN